jgi:diguanylate cyclase (GGDEF)-like protein
MRSHVTQRVVVGLLLAATAIAALGVHLVARNSLDHRRVRHLDAVETKLADALRARTYYLEDVADMIGVHDDADAGEFSRYAHVRGRNEHAIVSMQWLRRSPTGKLEPPADTGPTPMLVAPTDPADRVRAHADRRPEAADAIRRASLDGEVAISAPITLAGGHKGFYLAVPVQAHAFSGLVSQSESQSAIVGIVDAHQLVVDALGPATAIRLGDTGAALAAAGSLGDETRSALVPAAQRHWTIAVAAGGLSTFERGLPWLVLVLGLALSVSVFLVLRGAVRRRDDALSLAEERSQALSLTLDRVERANRELEQAHAAADQRARVDELTGIHNRRHFSEQLAAELAQRREDDVASGVLLLDLDHFKHVNDEHGHLVGDAVLRAVAGRIASTLRTTDTLARWGGEEFAILAPGITEATMLDLAERTRQALAEQPVVVDGATFELRLSVGAAMTSDELDTADKVLAAAGDALYAAKDAGRDCVRLHAVQ